MCHLARRGKVKVKICAEFELASTFLLFSNHFESDRLSSVLGRCGYRAMLRSNPFTIFRFSV